MFGYNTSFKSHFMRVANIPVRRIYDRLESIIHFIGIDSDIPMK